jgi:hypothetical protein
VALLLGIADERGLSLYNRLDTLFAAIAVLPLAASMQKQGQA